jgi:hypothetical protein
MSIQSVYDVDGSMAARDHRSANATSALLIAIS